MQDKTVLDGMSAEFNYSSQYIEVLDSKLHYVEQGQGAPILFLHGMPTSSYLWRKVIPFLAPLGRCIALDFIGMGRSACPKIAYTVEDHCRYLEAFIAAKKLKNVTLVMHGFGALPGLHYALRQESNCRGLVFYEAFLKPLQGNDLSLAYQEKLSALEEGSPIFDTLLQQASLHAFSEAELQHYRAPLLAGDDASLGLLAVLKQYLNECPRGDGQSKIDQMLRQQMKALCHSQLPKLLLYSLPGFITTMATLMWAKEHLKNLEIVDAGEELHYAQEAKPALMGEFISAWYQALEQTIEEGVS